MLEGLEKIEDVKERKRVAERLSVLLTPTVSGEDYPVEELQKRVLVLMKWLQGMLSGDGADASAFQAAVNQCSNFLRLIQLMQLESLKKPQVQRMLDDATQDVSTPPRLRPRQGFIGFSVLVRWAMSPTGSSGGTLRGTRRRSRKPCR